MMTSEQIKDELIKVGISYGLKNIKKLGSHTLDFRTGRYLVRIILKTNQILLMPLSLGLMLPIKLIKTPNLSIAITELEKLLDQMVSDAITQKL